MPSAVCSMSIAAVARTRRSSASTTSRGRSGPSPPSRPLRSMPNPHLDHRVQLAVEQGWRRGRLTSEKECVDEATPRRHIADYLTRSPGRAARSSVAMPGNSSPRAMAWSTTVKASETPVLRRREGLHGRRHLKSTAQAGLIPTDAVDEDRCSSGSAVGLASAFASRHQGG